MVTVGLRFDRRDAPALQRLADRWAAEGVHGEDIALFKRAAEDARIGEPLRVLCSDPEEAQVMADLFVRLGVRRPAVEALSGA